MGERFRPSEASGVIAKMRKDQEFASVEVSAAQQFHRDAEAAGSNGVAVFGASQAENRAAI